MTELHPTAREVVEIIAVACIVLVTLYKLASLYANTRRWNGLGRALRDEKWVYVVAWSWLIAKDYVPVLDRAAVFIAIAVLIIVVEVRVALYIPRVTIHHDRYKEHLP